MRSLITSGTPRVIRERERSQDVRTRPRRIQITYDRTHARTISIIPIGGGYVGTLTVKDASNAWFGHARYEYLMEVNGKVLPKLENIVDGQSRLPTTAVSEGNRPYRLRIDVKDVFEDDKTGTRRRVYVVDGEIVVDGSTILRVATTEHVFDDFRELNVALRGTYDEDPTVRTWSALPIPSAGTTQTRFENDRRALNAHLRDVVLSLPNVAYHPDLLTFLGLPLTPLVVPTYASASSVAVDFEGNV